MTSGRMPVDRDYSSFTRGVHPAQEQPVHVIAEDRHGRYQLPFLCYSRDGEWFNADTGELIAARVVGWKLPVTSV